MEPVGHVPPAGTETWVLPHRVADGGAQAAVRGAAPRATRVVHRLDAGRGDYRRDDADTLLSAAGANLRPGAKATARKLDDGPWPLPGAFDLVCELFDGRDEAAVTAARSRWQSYKDAGHDLTYWQQTERGSWEQKATD